MEPEPRNKGGKRAGQPHYGHQFQEDEILDWKAVEKLIHKAEGQSKGQRTQCMIALAWIFGKRINEILQLRKEDFIINGEDMTVRFRVGKKRIKKQGPVIPTWSKKICLEHPAVKYVRPWLDRIEAGYIFPSSTESRMILHKKRFPKYQYTTLYVYRRPGGYLSYQTAMAHLKALDPRLYWHFFRHSLATQMGKKYENVLMLKSWFDWENINTAKDYIHLEQEHINKMSKRTEF